MALPIKGSRPIDIAGSQCRWSVSGEATDSEINILVQGSGGILSLRVKQETEGMVWLYNKKHKSHVGSITPNWVRELSEAAIEEGWNPEKPESFKFYVSENGLVKI